MCSPVVRVGDRAEPFLARGVPNLKLHALPVKLHRADLEVYADRRDEAARELVLGEPQQQAALAHAWCGGGEERSLRLGTFLEVTGGAEARDGVRGSAREVNDEHARGRTAVSDEQQLDQVVVLLAAGPHLGARVGPKLERVPNGQNSFL